MTDGVFLPAPTRHRRFEWTDFFVEREEVDLPVRAVEGGFVELLASVVADVPPRAALAAAVRVSVGEEWSPWLDLGVFGDGPGPDAAAVEGFSGGRVDVDLVRLERPAGRFSVRLAASGAVHVRRLSVVVSAPAPVSRPRSAPVRVRPPSLLFDVPFRSQQDAEPALRPRLCSPASLAMVLAYLGVDRPTEEIARRVYDRRHDLYGNWARAVFVAGSLGLDGYLQRFSDWGAVAHTLTEHGPLVARIQAEEGELPGAPYPRTDGHLVVVRGFDGEGRVAVLDPAAADAVDGALFHSLDAFGRVWFGRGGTAYVLFPRRRRPLVVD